jgi:N-acetylmuramoyl-L-alanine amidase
MALRTKRIRRKWARGLLIGVGAAVVLGAVITGVVLGTATTGSTAAGPVTTQPVGAAAVTTEVSPSTTHSAATDLATAPPAPATTSTTNWLADKVIVIDPGHQGRADLGLEPIGPGSTRKKAKVSGGTSSVLTGTPESVVTLAVGLKLRDALEALGIKVVMTRTTQDVDIPNSARAQIGNRAAADLTIRLHCNGSPNQSVHGLFTLYPASINGWTDDIAAASKRAAAIAQRDLIAATGAQDRGIQERSDLTGFNWSDVPVLLVEMGHMTNPTEDKKLGTGAYQDKIVQGLVQGIIDCRTEYWPGLRGVD